MHYTVLLCYVKHAWQHALQPGNVVMLSWDREDPTRVIELRLQQLRRALENYINLCNTDRLYDVHVFCEAKDPAIHADPHYTALVKVLDRCTNQVTSFWIQENYTCMRKHNTVKFCNLTITKEK